MMMSVFYQGRTLTQLDHLACIEIATNNDDIEMITFAFLHDKPTLVGLDGKEAIIKPQQAGDEAMSFESLYDDCVSLRDFRTMQRHGVTSRDALLPLLYEVDLVAEINFRPRVKIRIRAKDEIALRARFRELLNEETFRAVLTQELASQIFTSDEVELASAGALKIADPAPPGATEWEIIALKEDDA